MNSEQGTVNNENAVDMPGELLNRLDNIIPIISEKLGVATDKAIELTSDTINQALSYYLISNALSLVVCLAALAVVNFVIYKIAKYFIGKIGFDIDLLPICLLCIFSYLLPSFLLGMTIINNTQVVLKTTLAPNLYILELAGNIVK